jgi:aminoglycoside phosphotransferase (APT) family kinase protein
VYGKVSARPVFERTRYTLRRLREAACGVDFVLPEPLGDVSELAIELFSHVPGETLSDLCERQDSARSCRRVAGALRQLHELHVDLGGAERPADRCRELAQARDELRVGLGGPSARVDELASALEAEAGANRVDTPGLIHGDFHGDNVLVDGETIALLDTEKCARGDPADDVGSLWAQLTLLWLKSGRRNPRLLAARSAFVERYLDVGGRALAPRVRTHAALHGFLYASRCLQRPQRRDRHAHARGLLDASTSLLEGGPL